MSDIILFQKDSPEDLILRGFTRKMIIAKTGVDVGAHTSEIRTRAATVDSKSYIAEYIKTNFSDTQIFDIIEKHKSHSDVLNFFGINGKLSIKDIFDRIGFGEEYIKARNKKTHETLMAATKAKYGVEYAMQSDVLKQRSKETCLEKYGVEHPMQVADIQKTASKTCVERYGVTNPKQCEDFKEKAKQTCLQNHGVEHPMQSTEIMAKSRETSREKYGTDHPMQSEEVRSKVVQTCVDKYGVENVFQSDEIKAEIKETMMERYGVENPKQCEEIKEKAKRTCLENHGVEYPMQSDEIMNKSRRTNIIKYGYEQASKAENVKMKAEETCLLRYGGKSSLCSPDVKEKAFDTMIGEYGVEYPLQSDEIKQKFVDTCMDRYGVSNPTQCKEILNKMLETKRTNGTFNISQPETTLYDLIIATFGEDDILTQYDQDSRYPFCCDFYIKSRDMFIELNAFWTHGGHWYNPTAPCDTKTVQTWLSEGTEFYKNAVDTWTISDAHKRQTAKDNNLNYIVFWSDALDDAILWFALGCPDGQDWHREHSWLPERKLNLSLSFPAKEKLTTSEMIIKAVKAANGNEFYKREYEIWEENSPAKFGYTQSYMFCNRFKYINKLPNELSDFEILRGMSIARLLSGYTSFYAEPMIQTLQKYGVKSVYDPCAGWGERLLACGINDIAYAGCDINANLHVGYNALIQNYNLQNISVIHGDSGKVDMTNASHNAVFTCPPYYNREIYTDDGVENLRYEDFLSWWKDVVTNSVSSTTEYFMYQIDKKHRDDMNEIISESGFEFVEEIIVGKNNVRHENRATGNTTKRNYEAIQVFKRR